MKHHEKQAKKRHHHECSLELQQAFKPHSAEITSMAIDSKGEILATGVSIVIETRHEKTWSACAFAQSDQHLSYLLLR